MVNQFVQRVVGFCIRYRVAVIIVTAAITGVMAWAVLDLEVDSDVTNLLPARLKVMELTEKYGRSKDSGELLVAVQADDLFSLEKLGALVTPMSGPEFDKLMASESVRWAAVIKQRNIKAPE